MIMWNTDVNAPCCPGEIVDQETGKTVLVQTDWDYPGVASTFGWSLRDVQQPDRDEPCNHDRIDGTVDCEDCGLTASDFIGAAEEWLSDNDGVEADDPGYFGV